jgi:pyruvate kinase
MSRKTKIIATLGPAVASLDGVLELIEAGMNVARLNFSHGSHDEHRQFHGWVRQASEKLDIPVAILQDIQGPRIRVGSFPGGSIVLEDGAEVVLTPGHGEGTAREIQVENLDAAALSEGSTILMSDGLIDLEVLAPDRGVVDCRVREGGTLRDHKGVAFPGIDVDVPAVTDKDRADLELGSELGVDYVAASFVNSAASVRQVKRLVEGVPVIAKIESIVGYGNLPEIVEESAGVMVARGDLGVELSFESVPRAQKQIISHANSKATLSITATEMLESMTASPRPTRAEVTDVSSAVLDGTDAVMLSAETAVGNYPARTVAAMSRICVEAEASPRYTRGEEIHFLESAARFASATAQACVDAADNLDLAAIVAFTESGSTARLISKYRPNTDIYAYTPLEDTYRRMALYSGVTPLRFARVESTDEMVNYAERNLLDPGIVKPGDSVVMAAGIPPNRAAATNLMKLHLVGSAVDGIPSHLDGTTGGGV